MVALTHQPERPKLQLSNGYDPDFGAFGRILRGAVSAGARGRLSKPELAEVTGLAPVRAENLASLLVAMAVLRPVVYRPTPFGQVLYTHDPFFDDLGTLWYMHYAVASNPRHLVWNRFADFLAEHQRFRIEELRAQFRDLRESHSMQSSTKHVRKEIRTVLNAYTKYAFARLDYLREAVGAYSLGRREPVPPLVLVACIARFREREQPGVTALPIADLVHASNSPGTILQTSEERFRAALEGLKNEPGLSLESRGDLDQLRLSDGMPDYEWMRRYYERR